MGISLTQGWGKTINVLGESELTQSTSHQDSKQSAPIKMIQHLSVKEIKEG